MAAGSEAGVESANVDAIAGVASTRFESAPAAGGGQSSDRAGAELRRAGLGDSEDRSPGLLAGVGSELDQLKELEPWAIPEGEASHPNPAEHVAAALERVARQIRAGEVVLPPESGVPSDAAALAAALAALLRSSRS